MEITTREIRVDLEIDDEQVSVRAYELWEQQEKHGQDVQDWLMAEEQLIEEELQADNVSDVDLKTVLETFLTDKESD